MLIIIILLYFAINYQCKEDKKIKKKNRILFLFCCDGLSKWEQIQYQMNRGCNATFSIIFTIFLFAIGQAFQTQETNSSINVHKDSSNINEGIFGVRWRFGDAFDLAQTYQNNEYFVLQFNSHSSLNAQTYVKFKNRQFSCGQHSQQLVNLTTYIHTCRINERLASPYAYQIIKKQIAIKGIDNDTHIEYQNITILFQAVLRLSNIGASILVLGDMIYNENGALLCSMNKILEEQSISIVVLGNFYPMINEQNYDKILSQLQAITSQVIIIPANQHKDTPQSLFYEVFFRFSTSINARNYKTITFAQLNFTIFLIDPDANISQINLNMNASQTNQFKQQLILTISPFRSIQDTNFVKQISLDMHISTQQTGSYSIHNKCESDIKQQNNSKLCPLYISQGKIDMINQKQDYGILSIKNQPKLIHYSFSHYSQCQLSDNFQFNYSNEASKDGSNTFVSTIRKMTIVLEYLFIIFVITFIVITYIRLREKPQKPKPSQQQHIQLVQQIVAGSQPPQNA